MKHDWQPHEYPLYTSMGSLKTYEFLRCANCGQEKLGAERPGERGGTGPYYNNGLETCPTEEDKKALERRQDEIAAEYRERELEQLRVLSERQEAIRVKTVLYGGPPPFTFEEARELYEAGQNYASEDGDGLSFEEALRKLGR